MRSKEDDFHISLETLWKYRAENIPLSQDELFECDECLRSLGSCLLCKTLDAARQLQQESQGDRLVKTTRK